MYSERLLTVPSCDFGVLMEKPPSTFLGDGFSVTREIGRAVLLTEIRNKLGTTKVQPSADSAAGAVGAEVKKCNFPKKIEKAL